MLDSLRNFGSSLIGKIMMGFLLVGLAGFGISGVLTSIGSNTVAHVGDQEITTRDFQRAYSNQLNAVGQQTGTVPTAEQAMAMGIPGSVLNSLAAQSALDGLAARMGLGASDDRLGRMLRDDPSFAGTLGQFDRASFQRALQTAGYTETEYVNMLRRGAGRQQIVSSLLADTVLPQTALSLINRYSGDRRTLSYYVLTPTGIPAVAPPTEAEMAAYLEDNQSRFRTEETRTTRIMVLDVASIAAGIEVSADEIAAEYEKIKSTLTIPETRVIRQVVLNTDNKAAFEAGQAVGKSFDDLVAEAGLTPVDLGELKRGDITDEALAETAFSLDEGQFAIIPGALGFRAVVAAEVNPEHIESLENASADIEQRLKEKEARNQYADVLDGIEELRAAFRPLDEIASRFGLDLYDADLTASGAELSSVPSIPEDSRTRVATTVFSTEMDSLAPSIAISANLNVWFDLANIVEARDQTLDEVRDDISAAITAARTEAALAAAAEEDAAALERGLSLDLAASTRGSFSVLSEAFSRAGLAESELDASVASAAFEGPVGSVGSARNGNGNYVVFEVSSVTPPIDEPPPEAKDYIGGTWRDAIYSAFVTGLRDDAGMNIAQGTLSQLIGLRSGN